MTARPHPRIDVEQVAELAGLSARQVQAMAKRAEIPGGAKFGRKWTFDPVAVKAWIKEQEDKVCRDAALAANETSPKGTAHSTPESKLPGRMSDEAYTRAIGKKRSAA